MAQTPPLINIGRLRKALESDLAYHLKPFNTELLPPGATTAVMEPPPKKRLKEPKMEGPIISCPKIGVLAGIFLRDTE